MQPKRSSLLFRITVGGFLLFLIGVFTAPLWMTGGAYAISPNGKYCLYIESAMNPNYFSYYTITLRRQSPDSGADGSKGLANQPHQDQLPDMINETLETITIRPHSFPVTCPREQSKPVRWSAESDFADVYMHDKPLCRVYVPD